MRIEMAERKFPQFEKNWQGLEGKCGHGRESCMNRVLFEVSYIGNFSGFPKMIILDIFFAVLFFYRWITIAKIDKRKRVKVVVIISIIVMVIVTIANVKGYVDTVIQYKHGHYIEVEGVVENYHLNTSERITTEYFTVDGVLFTTSDMGGWGYSQTSNNGGVIRGNGQHLRIRYVPTEDGKVIVYIEQLIPEEEVN